MALKKVALLDRERQVYLGLTEVEENAIDLAIHLPQINACDLPPHQYRWVPDDPEAVETSGPSEFGGSFEPLPREQRAAPDTPTLEIALAFDLLARFARDPNACADVSLKWLDGVVQSIDMCAYLRTPLVSDYAEARGLTFGKG